MLQRFAGFLLLAALLGLPAAVVAPRDPGLAIASGVFLAGLVRLARHR